MRRESCNRSPSGTRKGAPEVMSFAIGCGGTVKHHFDSWFSSLLAAPDVRASRGTGSLYPSGALTLTEPSELSAVPTSRIHLLRRNWAR